MTGHVVVQNSSSNKLAALVREVFLMVDAASVMSLVSYGSGPIYHKKRNLQSQKASNAATCLYVCSRSFYFNIKGCMYSYMKR